MNRTHFLYMYKQSAEMRIKIDAWLKDHPPPGDTPPLHWACHKFIEQMVTKGSSKAQHNENVYDVNRFHVPTKEIVKEAHARRDFGEDAGAALNKSQGRHKRRGRGINP